MIELINSVFKLHLRKYEEELRMYYEMPIELQSALLRNLLKTNAATTIGKRYHFERITSAAAYAEQVPVHTYELLFPYIQEALLHDEPALTISRPRWVAKTSGTTSGTSKYIPITKENIEDCHHKASWLTLAALHAHNENLQIFSRKNLLIGGGVYGPYPGSSAVVADISAILIHHIPLVIRPFYIPDVRTATLPDYETKVSIIAEMAAKEPGITMLGGVPTWNLTLYRRIMEITGAHNLLEVWPNLQAYIHGGVRFEPYREQFRALIPSPHFLYLEVYNASEGFFAIQDKLDRDDLLLLLSNGIYYEFIRFDDYQADNWDARPLQEVQTDIPYVMLITTNTGLYRYPMGDLVAFTATNPFRIKIVGRTQEYINAFGEDLLLDNVEKALMASCRQLGASVRDYAVAPYYIQLSEKGRHQWFIEFETPPADLGSFSQALDKAMQQQNSNYAQKRSNNFAIDPLEVIQLPTGFFERWLRRKGKLGGQHKIPKLANHRRFAEELLSMLAEEMP